MWKSDCITKFQSPFDRNMVCVGDSITVGVGATVPYPTLIAAALSITASNQGVSSAGWAQDPGGGSLTARAPTTVDPLLASLAIQGQPPTLVLFAGTNDIALGGLTGAQTFTLFQTYAYARQTFGWSFGSFVVATMLPRQDATEGNRSAYNNALVSWCSANNVACARLDLDSNIGVAGAYNNATYYQQPQPNPHPTNAGLRIIANLVCGAVANHVRTCPSYS